MTHGTRQKALKSDAERQDPEKEGATTREQEGKKEEERTEGAGADVPDTEPLGMTFDSDLFELAGARVKTKTIDPGPETGRQPELQTRTAKGCRE